MSTKDKNIDGLGAGDMGTLAGTLLFFGVSMAIASILVFGPAIAIWAAIAYVARLVAG